MLILVKQGIVPGPCGQPHSADWTGGWGGCRALVCILLKGSSIVGGRSGYSKTGK